jgi:predicted enzyme related to lactoylglutathione lyase
MPEHNRIDLIEFPAADAAELRTTQAFYESAFGWAFTDYGAYVDTVDSGLTAGINGIGDEHQQRMPLAVVYVDDLEAARDRVQGSGGAIVHDIYTFPGGRRFHFADPSGNELAVWSE